ncbi:GNAT family N-acetyltransferase [Cohnella caldifontis]|uniref:GNAT family N-acetyltransferase n=1 Tax=Cohnella caldifontis TaxID=3027471 RepID=UPI0023ED9AA8|nr:GNAT family N-acetyltransferase [Cohnella sp. YIM B05605]
MYRCLSKQSWKYEGYTIVPLRHQDIQSIRQWRNEQMDVLRQNRELTEEGQERYYRETVTASFEAEQPRIILFSYLSGNRCIGYGGLTNVDWDSRRAEISFLVETSRTTDEFLYKEDFAAFLRLMKDLSFQGLQFNRLFTETFDIRPGHIGILESEGFRLEGRMRQHVRIQGRFVDSLIHGYLKEYEDARK